MMNGVKCMNASQIIESMNDLKTNIYNEIHHRILLEHTGQPILRDEQLFFMLLPFFGSAKIQDDMKSFVTSVGIVHASLDEHEKIKEMNSNEKQQQLLVLSGDYYSGRYYELLAKFGNIELIGHLSSGIVARNEQQIKLYEQQELSIDEWLHYLKVIESELIIEFYQSIKRYDLIELAAEALTIIRMNKEIQLIEQNKCSSITSKFLASGMTILELQQILEARKQQLHIILQNSALPEEVIKMIEKFCSL